MKLRKYRRRGAPTGEWEVDVRVELPNGEVFRQRVLYRDSPSKVEARTWAEDREHHVKALARQGLDLRGIRRALRGGKEVNDGPEVPTLAEFQNTFIEHGKGEPAEGEHPLREGVDPPRAPRPGTRGETPG